MDSVSKSYCRTRLMKKIIFGILVVFSGLLLLGLNLGIIDVSMKPILFSWQSLLIGIGIINLFGRDSWIVGTILIAVGGFFLSPQIFTLPFDVKNVFFPVLIIAGGLILLTKIIFRRKFHSHWTKHWDENWSQNCANPHSHFKRHTHHKHYFTNFTTAELQDGFIDESNIFSGSKRKFNQETFRGGKISNVFGGTEIDLSQTTLADGVSILEIESVFGGVELIIPSDWHVKIHTHSVFGGFVDKRSNITSENTSDKELIIKGENIFGGGVIKNYNL